MTNRNMIIWCLAMCGLARADFAESSGVRTADTRIEQSAILFIEADVDRLLVPLNDMNGQVRAREAVQSVESLRNVTGWEWVAHLREGLAAIESDRAAGYLTAAYETVNTMTRQQVVVMVEKFLREPLANRWGAGDGLFSDPDCWQDVTWIPENEYHAAYFDFIPPAGQKYTVTLSGDVINDRVWIGTLSDNTGGEVDFSLAGHTWGLEAIGKPDDINESLRIRGGATVRVQGGTLATRTFTVDDASFIVSGTDTVWNAKKVSSTWSVSCRPVVGNTAEGKLHVTDGAKVTLGAPALPMYLSLGHGNGGRGILEISGKDSELNVHYFDAGVHARGAGEIIVRDGGLLIVHWGFRVGGEDGGFGSLTVDDGIVRGEGRRGLGLSANSALKVTLHGGDDRAIPVQTTLTRIQGGTFELDLAPDFKCSPGDEFVIIAVGEGSKINGEFRDLPDGTLVKINGQTFKASYQGGKHANSFTLTSVSGSGN